LSGGEREGWTGRMEREGKVRKRREGERKGEGNGRRKM